MCAMPTSGSIGIISAPQSCGSICAAVGCASGSLTTQSLAAGKTAPHAMTEFYGYSPATAVDFTNICCNTGFNISETLSSVNPLMALGDCFGTTYCYCINKTLSKSVSALVQVFCNTVSIFCCPASQANETNTIPTFTYCYNDNVCVCTGAYDSTGTFCASATICLCAITQCVGSYSLGTYTSDNSTV